MGVGVLVSRPVGVTVVSNVGVGKIVACSVLLLVSVVGDVVVSEDVSVGLSVGVFVSVSVAMLVVGSLVIV